MSKALDRRLLRQHYTVTRHKRFGNEQAASVEGGDLKRGQIVTLHAMCGDARFIRKAIAQDEAEQTRQPE